MQKYVSPPAAPAKFVTLPPVPTLYVTVEPGESATLVAFEYAPPPAPAPNVLFPPLPPPPMTSMLLAALSQSLGTAHDVPEVRKMTVGED